MPIKEDMEKSVKRFRTKAGIVDILKEKDRTVGVDVEIVGGKVDVLDVDNFVGYDIEDKIDRTEVEKKARKLWQLHDVVFIDLSKVPDQEAKAKKFLREVVV